MGGEEAGRTIPLRAVCLFRYEWIRQWVGTVPKDFQVAAKLSSTPGWNPRLQSMLHWIYCPLLPRPVDDIHPVSPSPSPTATTVTTPPFRCSSPRSATRGSPRSVVPNLRLEVSPASCYQDDYFFIFYAPPTATSHHLVRHALAEFARTLANVEGSSRFFHHSNPLCRLLLGPAVKELSPFSGPFYLEMKI